MSGITIGSVVKLISEVERKSVPNLRAALVGRVMNVVPPGEELFGRAYIMPIYEVHFYGGQMIEFFYDSQLALA
jgi:hypothetical protein